MTTTFVVRLAFVLYVVVEIALFVLGVRWFGGAVMFAWVLATAVLGAVLVRREGIRAIETMRAAVRERRAPEPRVPDRGMVATGGLLLMLPGLLTDLVGLVLVIPATRPLARRVLAVLAGSFGGSRRHNRRCPAAEECATIDTRPSHPGRGARLSRREPAAGDELTVIQARFAAS
jgi:UPF0716 family protein affecting phage T7 exclusion